MIRYGLDQEYVEGLEWDEILAYLVVFGQIETGKKFNWTTMSWPE